VLVKAIECGECKNIVYSRTRDDVRECSCGRVIVSGGLQHFNYEVLPGMLYEAKKIEVRASPTVLYDDWNSLRDEFGLICPDGIKEEKTKATYLVQ